MAQLPVERLRTEGAHKTERMGVLGQPLEFARILTGESQVQRMSVAVSAGARERNLHAIVTNRPREVHTAATLPASLALAAIATVQVRFESFTILKHRPFVLAEPPMVLLLHPPKEALELRELPVQGMMSALDLEGDSGRKGGRLHPLESTQSGRQGQALVVDISGHIFCLDANLFVDRSPVSRLFNEFVASVRATVTIRDCVLRKLGCQVLVEF
mmetsp:Transcript_17566/g.41395  ORF Transcript_17566/g.41395 Transcript_17566/m.41395 type:complete len:215 (+) Transcript_17566:2663-3307(+)